MRDSSLRSFVFLFIYLYFECDPVTRVAVFAVRDEPRGDIDAHARVLWLKARWAATVPSWQVARLPPFYRTPVPS